MHRPVTAALLALLLVATACSGGDDDATGTTGATGDPTTTTSSPATSPASDGPQACDLLSPADLQAALHQAFGAGAPAEAPAYGTGCTWGTSTANPPVYVSLVVATDAQLQIALGRVASALYEQTRDAAKVDENLPLGDAAYRAGPQVVVLDDGVLLSLASTDSSAASIAGIRALAGVAVAALSG